MKKLLLLALFIVTLGANEKLQAQACPDTTVAITGISPATLPAPCQNSLYSESVTISAVNDTCIFLGLPPCTNLTLVSATITGVTGLPNGITHSCDQPGCVWNTTAPKSHTHGCLTFSGTPTDTGAFNATVAVTLNISGINYPVNYPISGRVDAPGQGSCPVTGIAVFEANGLSASPNPTTGSVKLSAVVSEAIISNAYGTEVGKVEDTDVISLEGLPAGVYVISTEQGTIRVSKN